MKDVIQQLKDNEKPFGLMSEEMQAKARQIGKKQFDYYGVTWHGAIALSTDFDYATTYRLRPDYEDEPEIEECEIIIINNGLHYKEAGGHGKKEVLHLAMSRPGFIGFKYESGQVEFSPIVFKSDCSTKSICQFRDLAELEVLYATHVLFRRTKQE